MSFVLYLAVSFVLLAFARIFLWPKGDLHKMPGPMCFPIIGYLGALLINADKLIPFTAKLVKQYGGLFVFWVGWIPIVSVASAEAAEKMLHNKINIRKGRSYILLRPWLGLGLLTSDGARWFSHRRLITPTFHFSILERYLEIFQNNSEILVKQFEKACEKPIEIYPLIARCTLDVICEAAMGTKISAQIPDPKLTTEGLSTSQYINSIFKLSQLTTQRMLDVRQRYNPFFFITANGKEYMKLVDVVHNFTNNVIESRRLAGKEERNITKRLAFLDLLLEAVDDNGQGLSDEEIREEVDTFMFEGHDTTSAGILWTLYLLAMHPSVQEDIYAELITIVDKKKSVTLADLAAMKCLERTIKEALRLYPSVPTVSRFVDHDMDICGYQIPVHSALILHIHQLHRDPKYYPDPDTFDPNRFLPENCNSRHPFAYLPFSAGPRNCIGQKFAMLEEKMILSYVILSYKFSFIGPLDADKIKCELILRPPTGMKFKFTKRDTF